MRTKVTLVLIFLNVVLFFFIFKFERGWRTERATTEARRRVLGPEAANIQSLEISASGATPAVSLVKRGDLWFLTQPFEWPANPIAVRRIITDLQLLDHETSFNVQDLKKNGQSLADYGLETPALTVKFSSVDPVALKAAGGTAEPKPVTLRLGSKAMDGLIYLLSSDGEVIHVVGRSIAESLTLPIDKLRSDTVFSIPVFEVRFFNLLPAAAVQVRLRRDDDTRWWFDVPVQARASKPQTDLTINDLNALRVKSFLATPPPEAATTKPLSIYLEGRNRSETLLLYAPVTAAAPTAGPPPAEIEYYARMDKKEVFFTVAIPAGLKSRLDNAQVALRERRLLDFDTGAVIAITLSDTSTPDSAEELTLQRLDSATSTATSAPWQIVRRDAGQAPRTQPADLRAIQHLLGQLALLSAKESGGFISDAPTRADLENWGFNRPVRSIGLKLAGPPSGTATTLELKIGVSADRRQAFARVGNADSVYEVDPSILNDTPIKPLAYRDRLLRELPAGAQITGLKLVDLAIPAVLVEKTLPPTAGGQAPDPALRRLLEQLRVLRAKQFVDDRFTETITAAGEDRPWKYQLDVSIALVGGPAATPASTLTLFLSDKVGGTTQLAGSREFGAVWELEQPFIDALWALTYGERDPGPAAPVSTEKSAGTVTSPVTSPKASDAK